MTSVQDLMRRIENTLLWSVWIRMRETQFLDRSIALAGKAFISFFPMVIVVAAFLPSALRSSILSTLTNRLGMRGESLELARTAFASSEDIRRATGVLGLILVVLYATSFTTALQRVYVAAWRRPRSFEVARYAAGPLWLVGLLVYLAAVGGLHSLIGDGFGLTVFIPMAVVLSMMWWWFTVWFFVHDLGWRVLLPSGLVTGALITAYTVSATVWMPHVVTSNQHQFGFIGVALALVTWFSGTAVCLLIGACAGPVLAADPGPIGHVMRMGAPPLPDDGALDAPDGREPH